jgi:hypothetical protein
MCRPAGTRDARGKITSRVFTRGLIYLSRKLPEKPDMMPKETPDLEDLRENFVFDLERGLEGKIHQNQIGMDMFVFISGVSYTDHTE